MEGSVAAPSIRDRVLAVFEGRKPHRIPFIDRLELWHKTRVRTGSLPSEFRDLSLTDIHRRVGMGRQKFVAAYSYRLRGADLTVRFRGEVIRRESDPVVEFFPRMSGLAVQDSAGITDIELSTPAGGLHVQYEMLDSMVRSGTEAYIRQHLISAVDDYPAVHYLLDRAEIIPRFEAIAAEEAEIGDIGFVVPMACRIPFQQILLEYLGEVETFYALNDDPERFGRLFQALHEKQIEAIDVLAALCALYVEFGDNLHGPMTNPRLFRQYCLSHYQTYADKLHAQGKKMGSHTDGDMKPLLHLLPESGLDVAESFSPAPLTSTTFDEAWQAWSAGPMIWGGIPSPILEEDIPEAEFRAYVERLLDSIGDRPIILGVGDQVLGNDSIDRVRWIAELVEERA